MRPNKKLYAMTVLSAAVANVVGFTHMAQGATKTWTGAIADPNSPTYSVSAAGITAGFAAGQNIYQWNGTVQNWASGGAATSYAAGTTNVAGDAVVFTDNFNGGTLIDCTSSNLNPISMTFSHIAGSTPTNYFFLLSGDFLTSTGGNVNSSTPFGAYNLAGGLNLTLDTGFLGKVTLRAQTDTADIGGGNTTIKSGILELQEINSVPGNTTRQNDNITFAGGELDINIISPRSGNVAPGSGDNAGTYTVTANSTLALTRDQGASVNGGTVPTSSRTLNGTLNVQTGVTLTLKSPNNVRMQLGSNLNNGTLTSTGTLLLADGTNGFATIVQLEGTNGVNAIFDTGVGTSILQTNATAYSMGALFGGPGTRLRANGSGSTIYSIGSSTLSPNSTFGGTITDSVADTFVSNSSTGVTKVGSGVFTLTGTNTYTAPTTVSSGVLAIAGAGGSVQNSPITSRGGLLRLDNSANSFNDRLSDTNPLNLNQGSFEFVGNLGSQTNEAAGTLTIAGATNVKATDSGSGGSATITFAGLSRNNGIVNFNFDSTTGTHIRFLNAPTTVGGIIGGFATTNSFQDWAALDGNNNVVAFTGYNDSADPTAWGASDNIRMTTNSINVATSTTINSIKLAATSGSASLGIAAGQTLTLAGGGILSNSDATIAGPGTLTSGSAGVANELDLVVPDATKTLTINSVISDNAGGTVSLLKAGPGKLVLGASSSFTGALILAGGTLSVGQNNLLPQNGGLTVDLGTSFDLNGFNQSVATVTLINGTVVNSGTNTGIGSLATMNVSGLVDVRNGTISANLTGAAALTKTTGSTVTLSGSNSFTGGISVSNGTLALSSASAMPAGSSIGVTGGALTITGSVTVGTLSVAGGLVSGGTVTSNVNYDAQGGTPGGTISSVLAGNVGLDKNGANGNASITLSALNTYTGVTTINNGTIAVSTLALGGVASGIGASSNAASNLVLNGTGSNGAVLSYIGTTAQITDRLFTIQDGANNIYNASTNANGTLTFSNTGAIVKTGGGTLALRGTQAGANMFFPKLPSDLTLNKNDTGQWILGQSNTIDRLTDGNGTLGIATNTLNVNNASFTAGNLTGTGTFIVNNELQLGGTATIAPVVTGNMQLTKNAGIATLSALNTYTGQNIFNGGLLNVATLANGSLPSGIGQSSGADSNLQFNGPGTLSYVGSVATSTDRQFQLNSSTAGFAANGGTLAATMTIANTFVLDNHGNTLVLGGANAGSNTFAPSIINSGGFNKFDGGLWVMTGTGDTYSGNATIGNAAGGTLSISTIANGGVQTNLTTANGSAVATVDSTDGLAVGQLVLNQNGQVSDHVVPGTTIAAIGTGTVLLSQPATQDGGTGVTFAFANPLGTSTNTNDHLIFNGGTIRYTGPTASTDRQFTIGTFGGGIDSSGAGTLTFSNVGTANMNGSPNRTFTVSGTNTGTNTLATTLSDGGGATLGVTKGGTGQWVLTGNNSYTGVTTVGTAAGGTLTVTSLGDGGSVGPLGSATPVAANLVFNGGALRVTTGGTSNRLFSVGTLGGTIDSAGGTPMQFTAAGTIAGIGTGARTLTLTGTNAGANSIAANIPDSGTGTVLSIAKSGTGAWTLSGSNSFTGTSTVSAGTLTYTGPLAWAPALTGTGGSIINGGKEVFDYQGVVANDPAATVKTTLTAGFAGGFQAGKLRTSNAVSTTKGLGWKDDGSKVTVAYTYFGDANVDGQVTTSDFTALGQNFGSTTAVWAQGDFNYDGKVNALDFNAIATNFGAVALPAPDAPQLGSLVPEPASLGLLASIGLLGLRRRRQSR